ncbi:MAG: AGE family epimerase/isomerase [Anaerolineaceae bacterium]|nr:AGE family epimerase/isomerase [Anaerolineaceae bacterium]
MKPAFSNSELRKQFEAELRENILKYWMTHPLDRENGGFYGEITNDNQIHNEIERSAVLCGRLLWTYSLAYNHFKDESYLETAEWFFDYLTTRFWDEKYQGIYWALDAQGLPVNDRKHTYAQAFAIYGLSAYYQVTGREESLSLAKQLFKLIDQHTYDNVNGGNIECRARDWSTLTDMRLSALEIDSQKSMNTLLHLMEAYTALSKIWPDALLIRRLDELVRIFIKHIIDPETAHQRLFFDEQWQSLSGQISFGHDIEASWLLLEAAEALNDTDLIAQAKAIGVDMAQKVYQQACGADGSIIYEEEANGQQVSKRHWWAHAEAVVGFYNAYQLSGEDHYQKAALRVWEYIQQHFVDRKNGDWFKVLEEDGTAILDHVKVGPWECPYHHARMCMEMMVRLGG